jgi:predicted PurR-regulated permease PerM
MARASSGIGCGDAFQQKAKRQGKGEDELDERLAIVKQLKVGGFVLKIGCGGSVFACLCGGLAHVLPLVGRTPAWLAGAIYLYLQDAMLKAILMVVFGLMAGLIENFVRPLILKGRSKMHPLVSLVAIFGGIGMFGIMGIFLGPILAAVLIALLQSWPEVGQRFGLLPGSKVGEFQPSSDRSSS